MKIYKLHRLLFSLTLTSLVFGCSAQPDLAKTKVQEKERLKKITDAIVHPLVDSSKLAGMVVGIMRNDSILLLKAYGYADLEFNVPLPVNALFEIGSMTKQFTAVAIMQLAEKGLIKLSDNINKYLSLEIKG